PASAVNYSFGDKSELLRRHPVAYNGTVLHELYFENLTPAGATKPGTALKKIIDESYGSLDKWVEDMKAAAMSAHGWALTVLDPVTGKLATNLIQSEHHVGLMANTQIVAALDVWEHAYIIDFGIKKPDYIAAFFENVNWDVIGRRVEAAVKKIEAAAGAV
ncbi:MAG: Fe-Mn family superoxide dismutase, partial [Elusimicrobiota bacterium]